MVDVRICKECGDEYTPDAWWAANFPDFCSEDCEHFHLHPEEN